MYPKTSNNMDEQHHRNNKLSSGNSNTKKMKNRFKLKKKQATANQNMTTFAGLNKDELAGIVICESVTPPWLNSMISCLKH